MNLTTIKNYIQSNKISSAIYNNYLIALEAISRNKLRAGLTSLGIVFGVGSVISMLAIGRGAQQEVLDQMKILGATNIIITPIIEQEESKLEENESNKKEKKKFSPGLTLDDAKSIQKHIPNVEFVSPEIIVETVALRDGFKRTTKLIGIDSCYFLNDNIELEKGNKFSHQQIREAMPVALIGSSIRSKFFSREDPIGKQIKCGKLWLTVIGVIKDRNIAKNNIQHLGLRDFNYDIYTPTNTLLLRYKNKTMITKKSIKDASRSKRSDDEENKQQNNYHQVDKIIVRVDKSENMASIGDIISRMLQRRHNEVIDYSVTIPEQLLKQEQRTKEIFNIVLGAIASISLIVGGIGIMNIMLASILERTKEIGIRRAVGATRKDIVTQFLSEAITISVSGGIIGIVLGFLISIIIQKSTGIQTIIAPMSVFLAFGISISIGIIFGIFPAKRAANQDVIQSLRYE